MTTAVALVVVLVLVAEMVVVVVAAVLPIARDPAETELVVAAAVLLVLVLVLVLALVTAVADLAKATATVVGIPGEPDPWFLKMRVERLAGAGLGDCASDEVRELLPSLVLVALVVAGNGGGALLWEDPPTNPTPLPVAVAINERLKSSSRWWSSCGRGRRWGLWSVQMSPSWWEPDWLGWANVVTWSCWGGVPKVPKLLASNMTPLAVLGLVQMLNVLVLLLELVSKVSGFVLALSQLPLTEQLASPPPFPPPHHPPPPSLPKPTS